MKYKALSLLSSITLAITALACSRDMGRTVALVNGRPIYTSDVTKAMAQEKDKYDEMLTTANASHREWARLALDRLIQEAILLDHAGTLNITMEPEELDRELKLHFGTSKHSAIEEMLQGSATDIDFWINTQKNKLIIRKLVNQEVIEKIPVTEQEIKTYYKNNEREFHLPQQYRARQILVDTRKRADEIAARLAKGEDFAQLAKTYSLSPDSTRGGDLGFFSTKDFPPVFSEICARLEPGEVSNVKKTDYGYQIFQLMDKQPPRVRPVSEVRAEIIDRIRADRSAAAFAEWFGTIRTRAKTVIIDEALEDVFTHEPISKR